MKRNRTEQNEKPTRRGRKPQTEQPVIETPVVEPAPEPKVEEPAIIAEPVEAPKVEEPNPEPKVFFCLCGCKERLVTAKNPRKQVLFRMGHDARLHGKLNQILKAKLDKSAIPEEARQNVDRIGFLKKHPELLALFQS